jgi:subtilisin family serine protease
MSFGKGFSPYKEKVDEAFMYAASKGVLIMNAAGNDSSDIDKVDTFPNAKLKAKVYGTERIPSFISVGASARLKDLGLPASFSNYGKEYVDFFAPGHRILSTVPGNKYDTYSGTSMACPAAAGVAALVWGHYPALSAMQLKDILKETVRTYNGFGVRKPGADQFDLPVPFASLSEKGGVVDAKAALELTKFLAEN